MGMTENKRFTITQDFEEHHRQIRDNGHIIMGCFIEPQAKVIVDMLNELNDENEQLKKDFHSVSHNWALMYDEAKNKVEELSKENEKLKFKNRGLQSELQIFKEDATYSNLQINKLIGENDQLKISSTMYHNLFKELQRQMQGVKSIYDLDSKDFEDLIKLSKGNVFDDKIGWVHLPIEELQINE